MEFSDAQLVNEAMNGSIDAFERLMARYERLVFKIAPGCSGQRENALDISKHVEIVEPNRQFLGNPVASRGVSCRIRPKSEIVRRA